MNKKTDIENQINLTLAMFDKAEKLPPDPNFYTHLKSRLRNQTEPRPMRVVFRPLLLSALVVLNLVTAFSYLSSVDTVSNGDSKQTLIDLFAEDLNLDSGQSEIFNF